MCGRKKVQYLKALPRAPQGTLTSRFYLLIKGQTVFYYKFFGEKNRLIVYFLK